MIKLWKKKKIISVAVASSLVVGSVISMNVIQDRQENNIGAPKPKEVTFKQVRDFVETAQQKELTETGKYKRVKQGEIIDRYTLPSNVEIHEYESPDGLGYQIIMHTATSTISYGFGSEADARTYERPKIDWSDYWSEIEQ